MSDTGLSPLQKWQADFNASGAAWLADNPRPRPLDRVALKAWGLAKERHRARCQRNNPPPEQTAEEAAATDVLRHLNALLSGES